MSTYIQPYTQTIEQLHQSNKLCCCILKVRTQTSKHVLCFLQKVLLFPRWDEITKQKAAGAPNHSITHLLLHFTILASDLLVLFYMQMSSNMLEVKKTKTLWSGLGSSSMVTREEVTVSESHTVSRSKICPK